MRPDNGLALKLIDDGIAGHVPNGMGRHLQNLFGFRQVAELDGVVFWEVFCAPVANDFTDPAVPGYPEIMLGDGNFKFRQYIIIRLARFHLIIRHKFPNWLGGAACN